MFARSTTMGYTRASGCTDGRTITVPHVFISTSQQPTRGNRRHTNQSIMKKFKFLICALFAVVACASMTSCGDDDDDEPAGSNAPGVCGVWASVSDMEHEQSSTAFAVKLMPNGTGQDGQWDKQSRQFSSNEELWSWLTEGNTFILIEDGDETPIPTSSPTTTPT